MVFLFLFICSLGNCDFEQNGFCEWRQVIEGYDDLDWILHKGDTPSEDTGPKEDHTRGSAEGSITIYIGDKIADSAREARQFQNPRWMLKRPKKAQEKVLPYKHISFRAFCETLGCFKAL